MVRSARAGSADRTRLARRGLSGGRVQPSREAGSRWSDRNVVPRRRAGPLPSRRVLDLGRNRVTGISPVRTHRRGHGGSQRAVQRHGYAGDQSIGLQWDPPSATGGAPIDSYRIREFRQPGETFPETPIDTTVTGTTTAMTLSGLTNGRPYRFTVQAINGAAPGDQSSPSAPVTPLGVPEKVTDVKAKRGGPGEAEITWKPPTPSSARAGVTSYEIAVSPGGTLFQFPGDAVTATVPGLQTGVTYTFTVTPISATGRGPESDQSNPLTLPDAPSAPRNVRAAAGSAPGSAVVSWIPPASNGGVPMDSYRVCLLGGTCQDEAGSSQQSTFTGLTAETPLIFTVTGRNEAGLESPPATTPEVSLAAAPDIAIVRGPAEGSFTTPDATIEFATSIDGAAVTCFIDGVGQPCASPLRLTGLADGKHTFRAKAEGPGGAAQTPLLSWMVDSQDPKVAIDDLPAIARKGIPRLRYSGADRGGSGLASYQIRTRQSGVLGNFEEPVIVNDADSSPERVRRLTIGRGKTVCASVRAVDGVGHWSGWSDWSCVSRPLDQASPEGVGEVGPAQGPVLLREEGTQGRGLPFCVVDPDRAHGSRVRDRGGVQRLRTTGSPAQGSTAQGHRPLAGRRRPTGHGRWQACQGVLRGLARLGTWLPAARVAGRRTGNHRWRDDPAPEVTRDPAVLDRQEQRQSSRCHGHGSSSSGITTAAGFCQDVRRDAGCAQLARTAARHRTGHRHGHPPASLRRQS
ncbi:MAG: fibronectin type III domain-containing protein [Micrococcales bacterium]|nr:fibronectin type III domain-containing protein [Micrococcales bacterium]